MCTCTWGVCGSGALSSNQKVVGLIPGSLQPACHMYLGQDIEHQVASYASIGVWLCEF